MNTFQTEDPYSQAPGHMRMSLRKLDMGSPSLAKLRKALDDAKLKYVAPYYTDVAWAHFGFPKLKAVIVVGCNYSWINSRGFRERWKESGHAMLAITNKVALSTPLAMLTHDVLAALNIPKGPTK